MLDVPPPGSGFVTATSTLPPVVMRVPGTMTSICVADKDFGFRLCPAKFTVAEATNSLPVSVREKSPELASTSVNDRDCSVGAGFFTVNSRAFDIPPPGAGLAALTSRVLAVKVKSCGTVTLICVLLTDEGVKSVWSN